MTEGEHLIPWQPLLYPCIFVAVELKGTVPPCLQMEGVVPPRVQVEGTPPLRIE